jgi:hypothetical protein
VRFASAADRAASADELTTTIAALVSRYHDEHAPGGRDHRVVLAIHPSLKTGDTGDTKPDPREA